MFGLAGLPGLEPRLTESESAVLPLDDSPIPKTKVVYNKIHEKASLFDKKKATRGRLVIKLVSFKQTFCQIQQTFY